MRLSRELADTAAATGTSYKAEEASRNKIARAGARNQQLGHGDALARRAKGAPRTETWWMPNRERTTDELNLLRL